MRRDSATADFLTLSSSSFNDFVINDAIPFLYFVLYTFLIRHAILDITKSREDDNRQKRTEYGYIAVSVAIYIISYCLERR
jgi:hypothetical protein